MSIEYPIGYVYLSVNSTNPSVYFGGTWTQIAQGRVLIGVGTGKDSLQTSKTIAATETGGSYNSQKHTHSNTGNKTENTLKSYRNTSSSRQSSVIVKGSGTTYTGYSGTGTSENVAPYYGVYMWVRTA